MSRCLSVLVLVLLALGRLVAAEVPAGIRVRLMDGGANADPVKPEVVVTTEKQRIFHHHADMVDGGIWCEASIWLQDGMVILSSSQSVSVPFGRGGSQVKTDQVTYSLPADALAGQVIDLWLGNQVIMGAGQATVPPAPGPVAAP